MKFNAISEVQTERIIFRGIPSYNSLDKKGANLL